MFPVRQGSVQRLRRFSLCRLLEGGQSRPIDEAGDALTFGLMYSKDGHRFYLMLKDAETLKERPVTKEDMDMLEKQILGRAEVRAAEAGGQEDVEKMSVNFTLDVKITDACPQCGGHSYYTKTSPPAKKGEKRKRKCRSCGHLYDPGIRVESNMRRGKP